MMIVHVGSVLMSTMHVHIPFASIDFRLHADSSLIAQLMIRLKVIKKRGVASMQLASRSACLRNVWSSFRSCGSIKCLTRALFSAHPSPYRVFDRPPPDRVSNLCVPCMSSLSIGHTLSCMGDLHVRGGA
jgi:hypothetical protein